MREFYGLDLEDLARATRIRKNYLLAIEEMQLDQLPSRPFTMGYVRAYAAALGLDAEQAVARFKYDAPEDDEPLRAPVGVRRERDPRLTVVAICGVVVVGGILLWNVVERAMTQDAPPPASVVEAPVAPPPKPVAVAAAPAVPTSTVSLGAPLPPPQESTTPKPYVTPGLEGQMSGGDSSASGAASASDAQAAAGVAPPDAVGAPFAAKGKIFGQAGLTNAQALILQARKASSITVHRADGSIYFAGFLSAGEALRAPVVKGWTVEVAQPDAVDVYVAGLLKGPMTAAQAQISAIAG